MCCIMYCTLCSTLQPRACKPETRDSDDSAMDDHDKVRMIMTGHTPVASACTCVYHQSHGAHHVLPRIGEMFADGENGT